MAVMSRLPEVPAAMGQAVDIGPHFTPEEVYLQLAGIEKLHVELLLGRVVVTGGPSNTHGFVVWHLIQALFQLATAEGWALMTEHVIHIQATRDRPKPDLIVVPRNASEYDSGEFYAHGVLLAAEVTSPSNAVDDRRDKVVVYAQGKVPLYLLIDIEAKPATVTLFSNPSEGQYQSQQTVTLGEKLPLPAPFDITLDTAGLQAS
jgi:Uma2 family endonuclease